MQISGRMTNEAYATFRHPAVVPLSRPSQPIRAGDVHEADAGVQGRGDQADLSAMIRCWRSARNEITIRGRNRGDTGGAAVDASPGLDNAIPRAVSARSHLRRDSGG